MTSLALEALEVPLDRSLLHVFVAGPGYGEGIAVALPGGGWIVLDGCRVATGALPLLAILERWRSPGEPVEALLLTHPHTDHAFGIREVIETTSPRCVGVTTSPTSPALVFAAIEAELAVSRPSSLDQLRRRIVIDAMLAIRRRFDVAPAELIALVDGTRIPLNDPATAAFVRAPDATLVHARLDRGQPGDPNELSAVVELEYGATRIVLGSDLPALDSHGAVLAAGWDAVLQRHPHLGNHVGLKVPHHGSRAAFHAGLMSRGAGRTWWISPFNRGRRLPPTDPDGVPRLVALNGAVSLTATPRPRAAQPRHIDPAVVPVAELPALFAGLPLDRERSPSRPRTSGHWNRSGAGRSTIEARCVPHGVAHVPSRWCRDRQRPPRLIERRASSIVATCRTSRSFPGTLDVDVMVSTADVHR